MARCRHLTPKNNCWIDFDTNRRPCKHPDDQEACGDYDEGYDGPEIVPHQRGACFTCHGTGRVCGQDCPACEGSGWSAGLSPGDYAREDYYNDPDPKHMPKLRIGR